MFGKKSIIPSTERQLEVQTIPPDFYAGQNPSIKFKKVEKEIILNQPAASTQVPALSAAEKKMLEKETAPGAGDALHPANLFANKMFLAIGGAFLFILIVGGVSWYYWDQAVKQSRMAKQPTPPKITEEIPAVEAPTVSTTPSSSPPQGGDSTATPTGEVEIVFPSLFLTEAFDLDKDDISDDAEAIFGVLKDNSDKDGDGHNDGHEVYNLYNPAGMEPEKLIEAGTVKEYYNPVFGYTLYYPNDWAVGNTEQDYKDVLFSTLGGENIEVRVFDLDAETPTFADWFGRWAPDQNFGELVDFETFFKLSAKRRADWLVYYFTDMSRMYVIVYHPSETQTVTYRSVIKMMARSFRLPEAGLTPQAGSIVPQTEVVDTVEPNASTSAPQPTAGDYGASVGVVTPTPVSL